MRKNILKEKDIMDFEFQIARSEMTHLHQSIELLYILDGEVTVTVGENVYHAKSEDIIVINTNKKHSYQSEGEVLIAYFEIDFTQLCSILNTSQLLFWCNSVVDKNAAFAELRTIMKQIFNQYYNKSDQGALVLKSYYYQMLKVLTENFQVGSGYAQFLNKRGREEDRQEKIASYIAANYNKRISLQEMADYFYMSVPYLSKYIKKQFGMNFSDYLSDVRLFHAVDDLLYTEYTITSIAIDNGFASTNAFNELFKKRYQSTPTQYRQKMKKELGKEPSETESSTAEKKRRINEYLEGTVIDNTAKSKKANTLKEIDVRKRREYERHWNHMINAGRAADLLRYDMQEHILVLKKELGFSSVRIWDIFDPELLINENDGEGHYNFEKIDKVFDFLVENEIVPYIEMGSKPRNIHKTLVEQLVAQKREVQFQNGKEVRRFFAAFMRHLVNRYGVVEFEKWCFEQWNGEDFEMDGASNHFFSVFSALYEAVKTVSPKTRVGGGGVGIQYGNGNLSSMVREWERQPHYPDFLSLYCYPYIKGDEDGAAYARISSDREFLKNQLEMARAVIADSKLKDVEIHVSEWSFTVSNRNVLNDSCYKGAYVMKNVLDSLNLTKTLGYWVSSDIFAEFYDNSAVLFGGCGLLSKEGIKKPSYYAYSFLNHMKEYLVEKDENSLITTDGHDNYFIVCHNYQHLNYKYYLKPEDKQDMNGLYQLYEDNQILQLDFLLRHVKQGKYKVKSYSISDLHGSVQEEWKNMGTASSLSKHEVDYLRRICIPHIQIREYTVAQSELEFHAKMHPQEIQYIHISYLYE